jgi:hypothetical protein
LAFVSSRYQGQTGNFGYDQYLALSAADTRKCKDSPLGFGFRSKPIPENKEKKERGLTLGLGLSVTSPPEIKD